MRYTNVCRTGATGIGSLLLTGFSLLHGQQPQIPTLQVCNLTSATGNATVTILARKSVVPPVSAGTFTVSFGTPLNCNPPNVSFPSGQFSITIDMTDTNAAVNKTTINSTTIEQVTTTGHDTPTLYMNGRCNFPTSVAGIPPQQGCRYWLMIADNVPHASAAGGTPEVIGFLIFNGKGERVAYGTGPVSSGHITVGQTSN
jgi:hypothetical protein